MMRKTTEQMIRGEYCPPRIDMLNFSVELGFAATSPEDWGDDNGTIGDNWNDQGSY